MPPAASQPPWSLRPVPWRRFYQRDVAADETVDYDANEQFDNEGVNANEQFDNKGVNVGEEEMVDGDGGYTEGENYESNNNIVLDSEDGEGGSNDDDDCRGMASSSGLNAILKRARGKSPKNAVDTSATRSEGSEHALS